MLTLAPEASYQPSKTLPASGEAVTVTVIPMPVADSLMLIPIQVKMISSIATAYAVDMDKSRIRGFVSAAIGAAGATAVGKTIFATSVKLLPGTGSVMGGFINAGTAGLVTTALGEVFVQIMTKVYRGEMSESVFTTGEGKRQIRQMVRERLRRRRSEPEPSGEADLEQAYKEYLHEWLIAEDEVNDTMTEEIRENEFMPLIWAGDYETFPAEMLWNGMLENGSPMTFEEFVAAQ